MVSRILGEKAYNERSNEQGGSWSNFAIQQSRVLAANATARPNPMVDPHHGKSKRSLAQYRSAPVASQ
jgi:hypothetical protein